MDLENEQRAVEALIRRAFASVSREGGTSWSEAEVVDGDASGRTPEQARAEDTETSWESLVNDPNWHHEVGIGGFNFLDRIGFRYYIAPAMIRCIQERGGELTSYALTPSGDFTREMWSLLSVKQSNTIARFVRLMIAMHIADGDRIYGESWSDAYKLHWRQWDVGGFEG